MKIKLESKFEWKRVSVEIGLNDGTITYRAIVPGGWLYLTETVFIDVGGKVVAAANSTVFVPKVVRHE